jgi:uncharacterized membrane protein YhaH (DUF805 family)
MQAFIDSVKLTFSRYTDFEGRSTRSEYWYFVLFNVLIQIIASGIDDFVLSSEIGILSGIVGLIMLLPGIAVSIRRLHDIGKSGWFLLLVLIPLIGALILIYFFVQPSKDEGNPYRN